MHLRGKRAVCVSFGEVKGALGWLWGGRLQFYSVMEQEGKLRSLSIEVGSRAVPRRKHTRNVQSDVMPRRTQLKIVRIDEQILTSPTATNIINLEFGEEAPSIFKRANNRKPARKLPVADQKRASLQKELVKNRYHELFKESVDYFYKNTIQIGPCVKTIPRDDLNDLYAHRKLINIEKLAFPLRDARRDLTTRHKYKTLASRTNLPDDSRNRSAAGLERCPDRGLEGDEGQGLVVREELGSQYKREISSLVPARKPSSRKDYFVFGLSDRSSATDNKMEIYRDLLWKVNFSNGLFVCTPQALPTPYKFFVGEGNNSNLIRGLFRRRFWWAQAGSRQEEGLNFLWTQLKVNSFFVGQESAQQSEYFVVERMQSQSSRVSSSSRLKEGDGDPNRKLFGRIDYKIWQQHCQRNQKTQRKIGEGTYQRRVRMFQKKRMTKVQESRGLRMHNHLESNFYIGNKKALYYNLRRYLELKGEDPFSVLPLTFHVHKGTDDPEYLRFLTHYERIEEERKTKKHLRNIWIVKPGENTNRGTGITVCYGLDDIKVRLKGRERNGDGKLRTFILQKYIENPLLYNRRKFDLRHYMLVSCVNGGVKGYWYEEGYVRTSSAEFSTRASKDPLVHLTNDAIQKHTPDYGKYEKANKLSYAELDKYLEANYPRKTSFYNTILPRMKHFATQALRATYSILDPARRTNNFQLLGLDFMIDEDFQPWLIEVNTNPCLELCCPHLQRIIPAVVENVFKICIDPLFPPPEQWPNNRKPFLSDDPLADNKFELVFDQNSDGKEIERLYQGKERIDGLMGKIEEDDETFENDGEVEWEGQ